MKKKKKAASRSDHLAAASLRSHDSYLRAQQSCLPRCSRSRPAFSFACRCLRGERSQRLAATATCGQVSAGVKRSASNFQSNFYSKSNGIDRFSIFHVGRFVGRLIGRFFRRAPSVRRSTRHRREFLSSRRESLGRTQLPCAGSSLFADGNWRTFPVCPQGTAHRSSSTAQDNTVRHEPFCIKSHETWCRFGRTAMKSFLLACVAAIVLAALAAAVLNRVQEPVQQAFATTGVRL